MSTTKQVQASRANGARSKGPVTPQGKLNSSRNSTRHGLFAQTIVLEVEQRDRFIELLEDLFAEHQPRTPTEMMLVDTIAAARWRQLRIWSMQKVALDYAIATSTAPTPSNPLRAVLALRDSPDNIRTEELLLRHEIALDRQISRALLRLDQLQDRRLEAGERQGQPAEESITPPEPELKPPASEHQQQTIAPPSVSGESMKTARGKRTQQALEKTGPQTSPPALTRALALRLDSCSASGPPAPLPLPEKTLAKSR